MSQKIQRASMLAKAGGRFPHNLRTGVENISQIKQTR